MRGIRTAGIVLALLAPVIAGEAGRSGGAWGKSHAAKKSPWKYAGEDHGVRFYFKTDGKADKGPIHLKLENTSEARVDVAFRVMDMDWKKSFANSLPAHGSDSSLVYVPPKGSSVCYPYFDQVYLESAEGEAKAGKEPMDAVIAVEPGRT